MTALVRTGLMLFACLLLLAGTSAAQSFRTCSPQVSANGTQIFRCDGATIVAESGARFTLSDRDGDGRLDSVELSSKALLLELPNRKGRNHLQVTTPQAIAAVRGTKWAVDAAENKTSVFVVRGQVRVMRRGGGGAVLGTGEGVDVDLAGPLTVKRWAPARVGALMARLAR
jgi:ferric-dicitrate binding protein FerR (iron transport regulator)